MSSSCKILPFPGPKETDAGQSNKTHKLRARMKAHPWFLLFTTCLFFVLILLSFISMYPKTYTSQAVLRSLEPGVYDETSRTLPGSERKDSDTPVSFLPSIFQAQVLKYKLLPKYLPARQDVSQKDKKVLQTPGSADKITLLARIEDSYSLSYAPATGLIRISWQDTDPELAAFMLGEAIRCIQQELTQTAKSQAAALNQQLDQQIQTLKHEPARNGQAQSSSAIRQANAQLYAELKKQQALNTIHSRKIRYDLAVLDAPFVPELPDKLPLHWIIGCSFLLAASVSLLLLLLIPYALDR